jgi:uncharacterized Tic20 family protein
MTDTPPGSEANDPIPPPPPPPPPPASTPYANSAAAEPMTPDQERTWATVTHAIAGAAMILSAGTLGFVVSLVIYLIYKDKGPFIRQHAADAMNIQLNALLWAVVIGVVGFLLLIVLVGFLIWALLALVPIVATVLHVIGAIKAYNGETHWSPLTIKFVR